MPGLDHIVPKRPVPDIAVALSREMLNKKASDLGNNVSDAFGWCALRDSNPEPTDYLLANKWLEAMSDIAFRSLQTLLARHFVGK